MNSPTNKLPKLKVPFKDFVIPVVVVLLSLILSVSRAFNTEDITLFHRFALWTIVCGLIAVQVLGLSYLLRHYSSLYFPRIRILSHAIAVILTIPIVAVQLHLLKYTAILPKRVDPPLEFLGFVALPVAIVSSVFLLVQLLLEQSTDQVTDNFQTNSEQLNEGYFQLEKGVVPEWRQSKTLRIEVDDHYLRIFNETGNFYIRSTMSEAISLLPPDEGIRVHRSHWVSLECIKALVKKGRDYRLQLNDGSLVPVSRGRLNIVRKRLAK